MHLLIIHHLKAQTQSRLSCVLPKLLMYIFHVSGTLHIVWKGTLSLHSVDLHLGVSRSVTAFHTFQVSINIGMFMETDFQSFIDFNTN